MTTKKKGNNNGNGNGASEVEKPPAVVISPPHQFMAAFLIEGTVPYVQNRFSAKARAEMKATQEAGSTSQSKKKRPPKDFNANFIAATHRDAAGNFGIPASGIRQGMISACKVAGFVMTRARIGFLVEADSFDEEDGQPLVHITKGEPDYHEAYVRNDHGSTDIRARPMWHPGWQAVVRIKYDADVFVMEDIANLLMRVGVQVGIGEGRPDSKKSAGMGWGLFKLVEAHLIGEV